MTGETRCQVCGGTEHSLLVSQRGYRWKSCDSCGFAFLEPMPADDGISDEMLGRGYIDSYVGRVDKKMRRSARRARRLARRMTGRAVLDVGSNIGLFCEAARQIGLDPVGLEVNKTMVEYARRQYPNNEFVHGRLETADLGTDRFDGVYCSEVIEHVPDNNSFLASIAAVMKPGGVLYLTTPGLHEFARGGNPAAWRDFGAPDHKLYYTRDTLSRMLRKHGFADIRFSFNFGKGLKAFARSARH